MPLEDFKSALQEKMVVFLNEQKMTTLSNTAVLADEFVLTHKNVFVSSSHPERIPVPCPVWPNPGYTPSEEARAHCHMRPLNGSTAIRKVTFLVVYLWSITHYCAKAQKHGPD